MCAIYVLIALPLSHQVDANTLTAAATSGNEELVHWLVDECGVPHVYTRVSISRELGALTVGHCQTRLTSDYHSDLLTQSYLRLH